MAGHVAVIQLLGTPADIRARERAGLFRTERDTGYLGRAAGHMKEIVVLVSAFHTKQVERVAAGRVADQGQGAAIQRHALPGIAGFGGCLNQLQCRQISEQMQAAAGTAAALALRALVDYHKVVAGALPRPTDLRVGAAEPVAEVVGQLVAPGEEVEV